MVDFESLSDDFAECLKGIHTVPGLRKTSAKELWVDKHKPHCLGELAVHKKKVGEIRKWLEDRMPMPKEECNNNALLVTGQAGSGKSVAIHVLASQLGIELYEWTTPTPTLWQEHAHNSQSGLRYISKLDEFENFVEHIRKYQVLPSISGSGHKKPIFLLIDDIPVTNERVSHERLSRNEANDRTCHWEDLEASVGRAGACKVSFNPLTMSSIKKTLLRICREEKCDVPEEWIDLIARTSGESSPFALHGRFKRSPLKMDSPENILCQAHGLVWKVADFLHENVLNFLGTEAIGDAWIVASYLSDADYLLATCPHSSRLQKMMDYEPGLISQSAAASVAVRGVLFGNSQPLTSRWHTIRRPYLWQVEQSRHLNKNMTMMEKFGCNTSFSSNSISDMATDFIPTTKWLGSRALVDANSMGRTSQSAYKVERDSALDTNSLTSDCFSQDIEEDEIEDW